MNHQVLLRVTAHLEKPYTGPRVHFDALLTWAISQRLPPAEGMTLDEMQAEIDLPLAKLEALGSWVWMASAEYAGGREVFFYAVGNRKKIREHIRSVEEINGHQVVGQWEVFPLVDGDWRRCLRTRSDLAARNLPLSWSKNMHPKARGALHPPYWHEENQWHRIIEAGDHGVHLDPSIQWTPDPSPTARELKLTDPQWQTLTDRAHKANVSRSRYVVQELGLDG